MTVLSFPPHFPPTDAWNKFFIGVRWLGPDLSFFKELKQIQANRVQSEMTQWGGGRRQALAEAIGEALATQLRWKTQVFLPDDAAVAAFHGPSFDWSDPAAAVEAVIELLDRDFEIKLPMSFWESHGECTMGVLVDDLLAQRDT